MPYLFNICRYRIIVLAQLSKNARVIRVWLDVCVLQLVVSRKYLAHLYSKLFFYTSNSRSTFQPAFPERSPFAVK